MSLKSVAEKLAKDLEGAGKKLDRAVVKLAETVDGIVGTVPKAQLTEKGFEGLPLAARKAMLDGVLKVTDAAPNDAAKSKIVIEYLNSLRTKFPEGKAGDDAFKKFGTQFAEGLDQEIKAAANPTLIRQPGVVATAAPRQTAGGPVATPRQATPVSTGAERPIFDIDARTRPPGERDMGRIEPTMDDQPRAAAGGSGGGNEPPAPPSPAPNGSDKASRAEAALAAKAQKAADSVISNSLTDMHTVRTTNGKMPKQAFFGELQDALREKKLLLVSREGDLATTPEQVFNRIATRQPVAESEMRTLAEYFGRFHNDAKAAREMAAQPPMGPGFGGGRGMAGVAEAVVRRIPVSEGARTSATIAQSHAWETGATSWARNRLSSFQESPIRTTVGYAALATAGFLGQQTYATVQDFENPNFIGREIIAVITPDDNKEIHDYVEYAAGRFLSNIPRTQEKLKSIYGIEKFETDADKTKAVEAILRGPNPPHNPSPDITQALTMYVSKQVYGEPVATTAELMRVRNEQVGRANEAITRAADAQSARATEDAAIRTAAAQAALKNTETVVVPNFGTAGQSASTQQPAYSEYQVDGESFNNRAKAISYSNPDLYSKLADAFKRNTKMDVKPEDELTATNKLTKGEAALFAEEAKTILAAQKVDPVQAGKIIEILIKPTGPAPTVQ